MYNFVHCCLQVFSLWCQFFCDIDGADHSFVYEISIVVHLPDKPCFWQLNSVLEYLKSLHPIDPNIRVPVDQWLDGFCPEP